MHARFPLAIGVLAASLTVSFLPIASGAGSEPPIVISNTRTNAMPPDVTRSQLLAKDPADNTAKAPLGGTTAGPPPLNRIYRDESHCLTIADMRGDQDKRISCFCRDAIVDARYVHTYLPKDRNLSGVFLAMVERVEQQCGQSGDASLNVAIRTDWKWDGPEVVRTYPPDDVVERIEPRSLGGKAVARSVPFTVQVIYRNESGKVTRTENFSSAELIPEFK